MSEPGHHPAASAAAPYLTGAPIRCLECRYPLAGISADGVCPECGLSIARMRGHEPLDAMPRALLVRMRSGLTIILIALFCKIVIYAAPSFLGSASLRRFRNSGRWGPFEGEVDAAILLYSLVSLLVATVSLIGYWQFTTPEDVPSAIAGRDLNRRVARVAAAIEYIIVAFLAGGVLFSTSEIGYAWSGLAWFIAAVTWFGAHFAHTARLARRAGHESLATLSMRTRWVVPLSLVLSMGLFMAGVALGGGWVSALMVVAFPLLLLPIGLHVVVLWRTRSLLSRAIAAKADGGGMVARPAEVEGQGA
ncbi:MAG: hypothetical protein KF864_03060 [Phycisphaeraceae bacterium]|nr:hypothetical protein [Phycisphaeraceae bacterium]